MTDNKAMTKSSWKFDPYLLLILVLASIVRFWGIDFGLPGTLARPDESILIRLALRFGSGDLNPHFFNYPTLFPYLLFALYGGYYLLGKTLGFFSSSADFIAHSAFEPTPFFLISRTFSALSGVATVYIVYRIALELFDKTTARFSALFLALAYLPVRDSHFGVTDTFSAFLTCVTILFIVRVWKQNTLKDYLLAGLFAGLTASTKYYGAFLILPLGLAHFLPQNPSNRSLRRLALAPVVVVFAFFLGTPYALLDFQQFRTDFLYEQHHLDQGHFNIILDNGWWRHLSFTLNYGLGAPLLAASIFGAFYLFRTHWRKAAVLLAFPIIYYLFAGKGYTVFVRYMVPVIPFLCIAAAAHAAFYTRKDPRYIIVPFLVLLFPLQSVILFDRCLSQPDTRVLAARWINAHIKPGTTIYQSGSEWSQVPLNPTSTALERQLHGASGPKLLALKAKIDYLNSRKIPGYNYFTYDPKTGTFQTEAGPTKTLPSCMIIIQSPFPHDSLDPGIWDLLSQHYQLKQTFGRNDKQSSRNYDLQDTFYIPYNIGYQIEGKPGPHISIYLRKT